MRNIPRFIPPLTIQEIGSALIPRRKNRGQDEELNVFAKRFAEYIGVSYAVPAPSARVALMGILNALKLPKGGEVILPSLVFHCIPAIFLRFGLQPRFVDINPMTYCIDIDRLESAISSSTVAICPVHLYGRACNMDVIKQIASRHGLVIIEDCASACGAFYSGKRLGSFGQAAIFSFSPHKNLSVLGTGMAVTDSPDMAAKIKSWMEGIPRIGKIALTKNIFYSAGMRLATRPWFWDSIMSPALIFFDRRGIDLIELRTSESPSKEGVSGRISSFMPTSFHGRIGLSQLKKLDALNRRRIHNGNQLIEYLQGVSGIELPAPAHFGENIYTTFVIRVQDRQKFRSRLRRLGVDTHGGNMSVGPHLPGMQETGEAENAADAVRRMVHLPVYPEVSEADLFRVVRAVKRGFKDKADFNEFS